MSHLIFQLIILPIYKHIFLYLTEEFVFLGYQVLSKLAYCRVLTRLLPINTYTRLEVKLEQRKNGGENQKEVVDRIIRWWKLFRLLKKMPFDIVSDSNGPRRVILSEPGGSSIQGGQIVSWKNDCGEELLYVSSNKATSKSPAAIFGGISICFPQVSNLGPFAQHEYLKHRLWSLENVVPDLDRAPYGSRSSIDLILKPSEKDHKMWHCSFELRLNISLSMNKITLKPSVRNTGDKPFSFAFAVQNRLSISDISEVRIEGLETLDYLDNLLHKKRFTEQADALTFDGDQVNRFYLSTPSKIAIIDHDKKRTFVLQKQGLPDAVVWNPGDKPTKTIPLIGNDHKTMLSVDSAVIEKPILLKPSQVWTGFQEISAVSSSYFSGQLDPQKVLQSVR